MKIMSYLKKISKKVVDKTKNLYNNKTFFDPPENHLGMPLNAAQPIFPRDRQYFFLLLLYES